MDKRFLGVVAAIVIIFGLVFAVTNSKKAAAPSTSSASAGLTSHVEGKGASGVTLTEYGDYECPACDQYYPLVKQVAQTYAGDIKFQFRNFPLYQIHPNAIAGARAAEAADMQGKFWEMHDLLYQNQSEWGQQKDPTSFFAQYAKQLNLDTAKFDNDFKSSQANDRIQADLHEGQRLGVDSTPTFFIDGKKISNPQSLDAFNKVIETAVKNKTGKAPTPNAPTDSTASPATPSTGQ